MTSKHIIIFCSALAIFFCANALNAYAFVGASGVVITFTVGTSSESTSTPPIEATSTPTIENSGGGSIQPYIAIHSVSVKVSTDSAIISWDTNMPALTVFYWGFSNNYEGGSIGEVNYSQNHTAKVTGLTPGSTYYFRLEAADKNAKSSTYYSGSFDTVSLVKPGLLNVRDVAIRSYAGGLDLSWVNPDVPFDGIRVLRSSFIYPRDPYDGLVVYEGKGQSFIDSLQNSGNYYYSLFVRNGNEYSSGSIVGAHWELAPTQTQSGTSTPGSTPTFSPFGGELTLPLAPIPPLVFSTIATGTASYLSNISIPNFSFFQVGKQIFADKTDVTVQADVPITVQLDATNMPAFIRTVVIYIKSQTTGGDYFTDLINPPGLTPVARAATALAQPVGETYMSYLLRFDSTSNIYKADIPNVSAGRHDFFLSIFDQDNKVQRSIKGTLNVLPTTQNLPSPVSNISDIILQVSSLIVMALIVLFFVRRHDKKSFIRPR